MTTSNSQAGIRVSAPGKLMLLGEHAVVHRRSCLVTAVDARLHLDMKLAASDDMQFTIRAPDVGIDHVQGPITDAFADGHALAPGTRFIESALAAWRDQYGLTRGVEIETHSDFSSKLGLGSSSATVACTLCALAQLFKVTLTPRSLFDLGFETILRVQQTGSGFDLAAAIYGGTMYYHNSEPRIIEPLETPTLPLLTVYTGTKADTPTYVRRVNERLDAWPQTVTGIFDVMEQIVLNGRTALHAGDWMRLGQLMDIQHGLAHALGVDTAKTAALVFAAREAGALGAKLSGAGGGDCLIVLALPQEYDAIRAAITEAGGEIVAVAPHAPGVRVEETPVDAKGIT